MISDIALSSLSSTDFVLIQDQLTEATFTVELTNNDVIDIEAVSGTFRRDRQRVAIGTRKKHNECQK